MNGKVKKNKTHKSKLGSSDDLPKISNNYYLKNNNNENNNSNFDNEELSDKMFSSNKRTYTKVSKHNRVKSSKEIQHYKENEKIKRVKFSNIDVVDVESWKKYNLKLTAEENLEELLNISNGKKNKEKNISCTCEII